MQVTITKDENNNIVTHIKKPEYIKEIKNIPLSEYRKTFTKEIEHLFNLDHYSNNYFKDFATEFSSIKEAFIQIVNDTKDNPEILKEMFFNFCNHYINYATSDKNNILNINKLFLEVLNTPELSTVVGKIKENIHNEQIFPLIAHCIKEEEFTTASELLQFFLPLEKMNINNFDTRDIFEKRASISYLLTHFNGWNFKKVSILLSQHSLDNDFLDLLKNKSAQFQDSEQNISYGINNIVARTNITSERKLEILDQLYPLDKFNLTLTQYYISEISNGALTIEQLNTKNNKYFQLLKTEDFFKDFINHDISAIFATYPKIVSLNLWDESFIKNNLIDFLINKNKVSLLDKNEYYFNTIFENDFNNPALQRLLITPTENEGKILSVFSKNVMSDKFDTHLVINYDYNGEKFNTVNDFLKKYQPFIYCFKVFDSLSKIEKDKSIPLILDTLDTYSSGVATLSSNFVNQVYNYLRHNLNSQEFFYSYFVNQHSKPDYAKANILQSWFKKFSKETMRETIIYDFENQHPLHMLLDKETNEMLINKSHSPNMDWIKTLISYFDSDIYLHKDKSGVSVEQKIYKLNPHFYFPKEIQDKSGFLKKLFTFNSNKIVYQAIKQGDNLRYITSKKDMVIINDTLNVEQSNDNSDLHLLVKQSHQSLKDFQTFMDNNSHKNINVEVKIKSENILLKNITFLKKLDISLEYIPFEDSYFLKNNLNKYLMQSLQSYIKALDRYEALYESSLKTENMEEFENKKIKLDNEAIKQIELLDQNFEVVKNNIIQLFDQDLMSDMRIQTKVLQQHVEQAQNRTLPEPSKVAQLRR